MDTQVILKRNRLWLSEPLDFAKNNADKMQSRMKSLRFLTDCINNTLQTNFKLGIL